MSDNRTPEPALRVQLPKAPTGIQGLDEITGGGLPRGRPTLVCGAAGCGKTLLAAQFLVRGATDFGEPGVFLAFEENAEELAKNVRSLGFDLEALSVQNKLLVDYVRLERSEIEETGEYDLEGLFVRLGHAIDSIGAKRVVLDTIETLFGGLTNQAILRAELRRLFQWLKDKEVTAVITGERGDKTLTRQGLEEYVSDCVILLDHRVTEHVSTRRLRIVKYRGSVHGTNEYPFLIDEDGISVLPVTSLVLQHTAPAERVATGIPALDRMLGGGYYRGSSILVSGTAGTGKTSMAACFADAACRRGERCLYFAFEESEAQLVRNMQSIGLDLTPWLNAKLLRFHATRPTGYGLEMHLAVIHKLVEEFEPDVIIIDPISNFLQAGSLNETHMMLMRLIDFLKGRELTTFMTNLTSGGGPYEQTDAGISSLIDTWLLIRDIEADGTRDRGFYVLKSRGMAHSRRIHAMSLSASGIDIADVPEAAPATVPARSQRGKARRRHPAARRAARKSPAATGLRARPGKRAGGRKK